MKIALISTVRAPLNELIIFVDHHLKIGVDEINLFFDDPSDEGVVYYAQHDHVNAVACTNDYWLKMAGKRPESIEGRLFTNVNAGVQMAKENNGNWMIHIDSDELLVPAGDLHKILTDSSADALRFTLFEAISEQQTYEHIFIPDLFKRIPNNFQLTMARLFRCSSALYNGSYFRGHVRSKMAVRISDKIKKYGNHMPEDYDASLKIVDTKEISLLHFDCVGFDDWKKKWSYRLDGTGRADRIKGARVLQFNEYIRANSEGDEALALLYRRLHVLPKREKIILFLLGMLKKIPVDIRCSG